MSEGTVAGSPGQEFAYSCPICRSFAVDVSSIIGGSCKCRACGWIGSRDEMEAILVEHAFGSREGTGHLLSNDFRGLYNSEFSKEAIKLLIKWGFVEASVNVAGTLNINKEQALRYISAMARGSLTAIMEEREKIEKEQANGG